MPPAPPQITAPWPKAAALTAASIVIFGLLWELLFDPLRPGGSWLALKVLPLALALPGLWQGKAYTFKWTSLLIWLYVGEALVRIVGLTETERSLAWIYLVLSLALSFAVLMGARQHQRTRSSSLPKDGPS